MEIDESLVTLAVLGAAKEESAIRAVVVIHLQRDLELGILRVRQDDAAIARDVLRASERAIHHFPVAARLIFAGAAVAGLCADMPAFQRLAVEDGFEPVIGSVADRGESHHESGEEEEGRVSHGCRCWSEGSVIQGFAARMVFTTPLTRTLTSWGSGEVTR